jgi:CspA family cold shock protein
MGEQFLGHVVSFDDATGLGEVERVDSVRFQFHCLEIADGTRTIAVGAEVTFALLSKLGRYEAAQITRV